MRNETHIEDADVLHRGILIEFHRDPDPLHPWQDWDCQIPMVYLSSEYHDSCSTEHTSGHDILNPIGHMTPRFMTRHRLAIAQILDLGFSDVATFDAHCRDENYYELPIADFRAVMFGEVLSGMSNSDRLEAVAALWTLQGVPAHCTSSQGYSQGDYVELLFVAHPDWIKACGIDQKTHGWAREFEGSENMFGAWRWGGVIGFVVDPDGPDEESCWGFFPDHDQDYFPIERNHAYCIGVAKAAADYIADRRDTATARCIEQSRPDMHA